MQAKTGTLWTIGHSTRPWEDFVTLLQGNAIACVVDVRRFAGSRHNPQYSPLAMAPELQAAGIVYLPMPDLGGRRATSPQSRNGAWRVAAFRGYADYMATPGFAVAREQLMAQALAANTVVVCAEAVWWRCHRRLISDDFTARGWTVRHIMGPGKLQEHVLNVDARMDDGVLCYPAPDDAQQALP